MPLCGSSADEQEPPDEYDALPFSLRWRLHFGKKDKDPHTGEDIIKLGGNRIIRTHCESTEYQALLLVDRHTSVPINKVMAVYNRPEGKMVEYEALPGRTLESLWPKLAALQRQKIIGDLGRFIDQLRKMEPPKHCVVGDATLGAALDHRFGSGKIGPFYTIAAFQEFERRGHAITDFPQKEVQQTHAPVKPYTLKFTHANFVPSNILVDEANRVCALIGWESAGWYPEYWEYTQTCTKTPNFMADWLDAMRKVMPKYDVEFVAEKVLRGRFPRGSIYDAPRSVRAPSPTPSELDRERQEIDDKNTESTSG